MPLTTAVYWIWQQCSLLQCVAFTLRQQKNTLSASIWKTSELCGLKWGWRKDECFSFFFFFYWPSETIFYFKDKQSWEAGLKIISNTFAMLPINSFLRQLLCCGTRHLKKKKKAEAKICKLIDVWKGVFCFVDIPVLRWEFTVKFMKQWSYRFDGQPFQCWPIKGNCA